MPLTSGARLGPYEVIGPLGAGGMGEVYKARDMRLDRTVAVKVLNEDMMVVSVRTTGSFGRDAPQRLFPAGAYFGTNVRNFDIARDGQRFLMIKELPGAVGARPEVTINVVLNWSEELKQRVGN